MKIRLKLILVFVLIIIASSIITIMSAGYVFSTFFSMQLENNIKSNLQDKSQIIFNFLRSYDQEVLLISDLPSISNFANAFETMDYENISTHRTLLENTFVNIIKNQPDVFQIRYLSSNGHEVVRVDADSDTITIVPQEDLQDKADREYFKKSIELQQNHVYVSDLELNEEFGKIQEPRVYTVRFATPITNPTGDNIGVFILNVDVSTQIPSIIDTTDGQIMLFNEDGEIKMHADESQTFGTQLGTGISFFAENPQIKDSIETTDSNVLHLEDKNFIVWEKIQYTDDPLRYWVLFYQISEDELFSPVNNFINWIVIIAVSFAIATIIILTTVSHKITIPLIKLRDSAIKVSNGDYSTKLKPSSDDEIGELTESFQKMLDSLKQSKSIVDETLKELKSKNRELKKTDTMKSEFASMITHELKTPLTPIKGYCEMLQDPKLLGTLNKDQLESVEEIKNNAVHLERLISDILDAQKLEMNKMKFGYAKFAIDSFLETIHKDMMNIANEKKIDFRIEKPVGIEINSDKGRLRQVMDNLIRNAIDFVPENEGVITIGAKNTADGTLFFVKDNGIGIGKQDQKHLFMKFYQVDTSVTRKHGGTGLGLVICKGIVEGLGGKIWVDSELGSGTTFKFIIPKL